MLSIGTLAQGQVGYYESQVAHGRDDYYSGRGEAPGEWAGRGSRALGLNGRVQAERFNALMAGINPADPQLEEVLRDPGRGGRIAAYDLTFSAPKSVSVLFATADEHTSRELVQAHEAAVSGALSYLEDVAVSVRRGRGGRDVQPAGGLVAAAYRHRMSRALDPQLHTHVVAANMAQGADGRWTGLWGTPLFTEAKTAGYLYQAHLRAEVRDRLGLQWGPVVKGSAELLAVPEGVRAHFSKRRAEILRREAELIAQTGRPLGDGGRELVAHDTKERKQYGIETHTWREEQIAMAGEHGLDQQAITAAVDEGRRRLAARAMGEYRDARALGDWLAGADGLTEKANTFAQRDVLREVAASAGQGARVDQVREEADAFAARGDVLQTSGGELTSADLVAAERRLIAAAIGRAGEGTAIIPPDVLQRTLRAADRPLTAQQAAAVRAVATSGNGVDVIQALAGTGKTFCAGTIRRVYEDAGYTVVGVGPTGRAVRELAEEAGVAAWTIDRALIDLERFGEPFAPGTVVIVDEAGMAATRSSERILTHAEQAGAKLIAIGDSGQLASVQAGGWMAAVAERVGAHALTEVLRQRDREERRALGQLHASNPDGYLSWADECDRLAVHTTSDAHAAALQ
ncbi:MAG: relaxase domain-containing protein, partial [Chloroflexota bacterium]|nr:relaxase domain-containing protein [Chloroflexota bacterium]